jgi:hypothetical protein
MFIVFLATVYLVIGAFLLGTGTGIGHLLNWLAPDVGLGTAILIGLVTTCYTTHCLARLMSCVVRFRANLNEDDEQEIAGEPLAAEAAHFFQMHLATPRRRRQRGA